MLPSLWLLFHLLLHMLWQSSEAFGMGHYGTVGYGGFICRSTVYDSGYIFTVLK